MKKFTFVFEYSDTYYDSSFQEPMTPSIISIKVPDELSNSIVFNRIKEIHNLIKSQKIDKNFNVVEEREGYDWYGEVGNNAGTLITIVCRLTGWIQVPTNDTSLIDFDTFGD